MKGGLPGNLPTNHIFCLGGKDSRYMGTSEDVNLCASCRATPAHVIRCILGTALRAAVWGSALNWGLALAGKSRSFWATKAVAVSVRTSKKLFTSRFNLRKTFREAKAASKEVGESTGSVQKFTEIWPET